MRKKFVFDYKSLTYKEVTFSLKQFFQSFLFHASIALTGGIILGIIFVNTLKTPEERQKEFENTIIAKNIQDISAKAENIYTKIQQIEKHDLYSYRPVLGMKTPSSVYHEFNIGGSEKYSYLKNYPYSALLKSTNLKLDYLLYRLAAEAKSLNKVKEVTINREKYLAAKPTILPMHRRDLKRIGPFGWRIHPIYHVLKFHEGVDLMADRGTPVYASGDGLVLRADAASKGYGNHIRISHGFGYVTFYAHLSKILVKPGQFVKRGQLIGLVGSTGLSTGPHLHYEVRINGKPVNPINFFYNDITEEQYNSLIKEASTQK